MVVTFSKFVISVMDGQFCHQKTLAVVVLRKTNYASISEHVRRFTKLHLFAKLDCFRLQVKTSGGAPSVGCVKTITHPIITSSPHFQLKTKPETVFDKLRNYKSNIQNQKITRKVY
jgi:hypothetical protein